MSKYYIFVADLTKNYIEICGTWDRVHALTFSPAGVYIVRELRTRGKTYAERKANAAELARELQSIESETSGGGLSWGEYSIITNFFEEVGRRFGLLREFRENCII